MRHAALLVCFHELPNITDLAPKVSLDWFHSQSSKSTHGPCECSIDSVRHLLRWGPYRGTASLSLRFPLAMAHGGKTKFDGDKNLLLNDSMHNIYLYGNLILIHSLSNISLYTALIRLQQAANHIPCHLDWYCLRVVPRPPRPRHFIFYRRNSRRQNLRRSVWSDSCLTWGFSRRRLGQQQSVVGSYGKVIINVSLCCRVAQLSGVLARTDPIFSFGLH